MDEAVLITTMLRQRIVAGPGMSPVTGDGILLAAATIYNALMVSGNIRAIAEKEWAI